jgi:hypothetical protein
VKSAKTSSAKAPKNANSAISELSMTTSPSAKTPVTTIATRAALFIAARSASPK